MQATKRTDCFRAADQFPAAGAKQGVLLVGVGHFVYYPNISMVVVGNIYLNVTNTRYSITWEALVGKIPALLILRQ